MVSASALANGRPSAEARFGILQEIATKAWSYLPRDMRQVLTALYEQEKSPSA